MTAVSPLPPAARGAAFIVALAFFMENLDATVLATALPTMARDFGTTPTALSLGITAYVLALAVFIPVSGWMADRFGTRTVFAAAVGVFTVASIACGSSDSVWTFIAARTLQGAAAAMMSPVGRLVVLQMTPRTGIVAAIAIISWPGLVAPVVGPAVGGFLVTYASWRWIFFLNVPIGLVGIVLIWRYIQEIRHPERRPFDYAGFATMAGGLASLLFAFHLLAEEEARYIAGAALAALGSGLLWFFVRRAARTPHPLVNLSILRIPTFALSAVWAGSLFRVTAGAMPVLLPLFFQISFGMTAFAAGLLVLAYAGGNLVMKSITTGVLRRFGFWHVLIVNGVVASLLILACAAVSPGTPLPAIAILLAAAGSFRSLQLTCIQTLTFADVPAELRSSATTLSATLQQLALSLGVALAMVVLNMSATLRDGGSALGRTDFQVAFALMGLIGLASTLRFLRLERDAGAEIAGRG